MSVTVVLFLRHGGAKTPCKWCCVSVICTLTEQQNAILQKIKDNHTELMNLGERDAFCRGFSLAVRLMVEAMSSEKT